ncbi:EAL domain-containing protein [Paraburkholderia phymatum]|uniref:EAL domain-containing protein n=1 Tax=Paraburkholderia phymatum TaxID=148447 RepID=A0ACC6UBN2_9BURK
MSKHLYLVPPCAKLTLLTPAEEAMAVSTTFTRENAVSVNYSDTKTTCVVASIRNLVQIEGAYGTDAALAVRHIVHERAREFSMRKSGIVTFSGGLIFFVMPRNDYSDSDDVPHVLDDNSIVESVIAALGDEPVPTATGMIRAAIDASTPPDVDEPFDLDEVGSHAAQMGGKTWRAGYMADMQTANGVFDSLERGELCFRYEKVCSACDIGIIGYYEALLCTTENGMPVSVGNKIPVLERLGLIGRLDKWVVASVIETLRACPDVSLGCNVSVQSATLDGWWATIIERLTREPQVARRLVVEITESAPFTDMDALRDFIRVLRLLGCRVALDDVGAGHSCLKSLTELRVDMVKVDGSYLRHARATDRARARLRSLVQLARLCASHVVLEGIEREADVQISLACDAQWVQGYLFDPIFGSDLTHPVTNRDRGD